MGIFRRSKNLQKENRDVESLQETEAREQGVVRQLSSRAGGQWKQGPEVATKEPGEVQGGEVRTPDRGSGCGS
jgi:hypothetical protein